MLIWDAGAQPLERGKAPLGVSGSIACTPSLAHRFTRNLPVIPGRKAAMVPAWELVKPIKVKGSEVLANYAVNGEGGRASR